MPIFQIGIDITRLQSTIMLVKVEAESEEEAKKLARAAVDEACFKARSENEPPFKRIHYYGEWDFDTYDCHGVSNESFPEADYAPDLDLTVKKPT